jgi:Tfp pilus assembly protein PilO
MTNKTWVYFALLGVSLVIGGLLLREPLLSPYRDLQTRIAADELRVKELQAEIAARQHSRDDAVRLSAAFGPALEPDRRAVRAAWFYSQIESNAAASGMELVSLQPRPAVVEETGLLRFPVAVSLQGDMAGLVGLLAQFRATTALVGIDRLVVQRRDDARKSLAVQATMAAYGLADPQTRAKLAAEAAKRSAGRSRG